jgi:hypothetical protein
VVCGRAIQYTASVFRAQAVIYLDFEVWMQSNLTKLFHILQYHSIVVILQSTLPLLSLTPNQSLTIKSQRSEVDILRDELLAMRVSSSSTASSSSLVQDFLAWWGQRVQVQSYPDGRSDLIPHTNRK